MTIGAFSLPAPAAVSPEAVRAWLDEEWVRAQRIPRFDGFGLTWRQLDHTTQSEEEIARMRDEVQGKPHHPMRGVLELIDERFRTGSPTTSAVFTLFLDGEGRWRFNRTTPFGEYFDCVRTADAPWRLTSKSLVLYDPGESDVPGKTVTDEEASFLPMIGELLFGGLNLGRISRIDLGRVVVEGSRWRAVAGRPTDVPAQLRFTVEYLGRWDNEHQRGFVEEFRIIEHGSRPDAVGQRRTFLDWAFHPVARMWIAARSDRYLATGQLSRTLEFVSADPLPPGGFAAIAAPPAVDGADPIRGPVTFTSIVDHRVGLRSDLDRESGLMLQSPLPLPTESSGSSRLRVLGWVLLILASAFLGLLLVRRHRMGRTVPSMARSE